LALHVHVITIHGTGFYTLTVRVDDDGMTRFPMPPLTHCHVIRASHISLVDAIAQVSEMEKKKVFPEQKPVPKAKLEYMSTDLMWEKNMVRCLIVFLCAWHTVVCLFGLLAGIMYATTHIYGPTLKFSPQKRSKILRDCPVTTETMEDLIVQPYQTEEDAFETFDTHGAAIIPSVLSRKTAQELRDFVNRANPEMHQVYVHNRENRYRIMPTPFENTVVHRAMAEIATHGTLKPLLDNVLGPKASLIAFSAITSTYGAESQDWHRDTGRSPMTHPTKFVHEVTLTIPLQDTTADMGATGICPGTHRCNWIEGVNKDDHDVDEKMPCPITASISQGDAMVYHTDLIHKGGAHVDENAPDRIVLFVSFAESKKGTPEDSRKKLAYGKVYSLDWRMWGVSIDDFPFLRGIQWRWSYLHPLGIRFFNSKTSGNNRGSSSDDYDYAAIKPWNAVDAFLHIFDRPGDTTAHFLADKFDSKEAQKHSATLLLWAVGVVVTYFWIGVPLWAFVGLHYVLRVRNNNSLP